MLLHFYSVTKKFLKGAKLVSGVRSWLALLKTTTRTKDHSFIVGLRSLHGHERLDCIVQVNSFILMKAEYFYSKQIS